MRLLFSGRSWRPRGGREDAIGLVIKRSPANTRPLIRRLITAPDCLLAREAGARERPD
jgi:hypothetical protein